MAPSDGAAESTALVTTPMGGKWDQVGTILATDGHYRMGVYVLTSERSHLGDLPPIHHHGAMA